MSDPYFTFPLWLLAYESEPKARLQAIVSSSLVRAGESYRENPKYDRSIIDEYLLKHQISGFNRKSDKHLAIVAGASICAVTIHSVDNVARESDGAREFYLKKDNRHGRGPLVMIASSLLWGCHNSDFPSYRDFSTLCAINSVAGWNRVEPVRITRDMIIARQLGYKTPDVMRRELFPGIGLGDPDRTDGAKPLTTQQVRDVLTRLETAKMIARCQPSRRVVYFSTNQSAEELRSKVKAMVDEKNAVKAARAADRTIFNHSGTIWKP